MKTNRERGRKKKKKVNYSKHSESEEKINKEEKLAVTHSANAADLGGKGAQEQANNSS